MTCCSAVWQAAAVLVLAALQLCARMRCVGVLHAHVCRVHQSLLVSYRPLAILTCKVVSYRPPLRSSVNLLAEFSSLRHTRNRRGDSVSQAIRQKWCLMTLL